MPHRALKVVLSATLRRWHSASRCYQNTSACFNNGSVSFWKFWLYTEGLFFFQGQFTLCNTQTSLKDELQGKATLGGLFEFSFPNKLLRAMKTIILFHLRAVRFLDLSRAALPEDRFRHLLARITMGGLTLPSQQKPLRVPAITH